MFEDFDETPEMPWEDDLYQMNLNEAADYREEGEIEAPEAVDEIEWDLEVELERKALRREMREEWD